MTCDVPVVVSFILAYSDDRTYEVERDNICTDKTNCSTHNNIGGNSVCVCVYVIIKLYISAQFGPAILVCGCSLYIESASTIILTNTVYAVAIG